MKPMRFAALPFALRFALRDLLGDPRGFGVFIACIVIGVAAISGVSGLSRSLAQGLAREGRTILGGDASFSLVSREFSPEQRAFFEARGRLSEISLMRAMARRDDGEAALVEIKAVDPATYPTFGAVALDPDMPLAEALEERDGLPGVAVDPMLLARLDAKLGDTVMIGVSRFSLRAILRSEPDKLAGGIGFGPRVMMTRAALSGAELATPGSIVRHVIRVTLRGAPTPTSRRSPPTPQTPFRKPDGSRARGTPSRRSSRAISIGSPSCSPSSRSPPLSPAAPASRTRCRASSSASARNSPFSRRSAPRARGSSGSPSLRFWRRRLSPSCWGLVAGAAIPWGAAQALRDLADLPVSASLDAQGALYGALYGLLVVLDLRARSSGPRA